jgi:hypothetical protein
VRPSQLWVLAFRSREPQRSSTWARPRVWYTRSAKYRRPFAEYDHGVMLAIECTALRILAREVAVKLAVVTGAPVEQHRDMRNANLR